jgi:hypothetical protein
MPGERPGQADYWLPGTDTFDEALATEIVETVRRSPRSVGWLCLANPHWPCLETIHNWRARRPEFRAAFEEARTALADEMAFQTIEIADDSSGDVKLVPRKDGSVYRMNDPESAKRSELKVRSRQWLCSKIAPAKYGERLDATVRHGVLTQEEALDLLR